MVDISQQTDIDNETKEKIAAFEQAASESSSLIDSFQTTNEELRHNLEELKNEVSRHANTAFEAENYCASLKKALESAIVSNDEVCMFDLRCVA